MSACDTYAWCDATQHDPTSSRQVHSLPERRVEWLTVRPMYEAGGTPYLYVDTDLDGTELLNADGIESFQEDLRLMVDVLEEEADRLDELAAAVRGES